MTQPVPASLPHDTPAPLSATGPHLPSPSGEASVSGQTPLTAATVAVPGYEVLGVLGRGGMGIVYLARQVGLNRRVALKTIRTGAQASSAEVGRFRAEAETAARLQHPHIVQI